MKEAEVARQTYVGGCVLTGTKVEYIDRGREEERELERCADWRETVRRRVVRGEDRNVEGVVL
jgi:hypothetical protein